MDLTSLISLPESDAVLQKEARRQVKACACTSPELAPFESDINWGDTGAIDHILQNRSLEGSQTTSIRTVAGKQAASAVPTPVEVGTRVAFVTNLGSILSYEDIPGDKVAGTVVKVRCADGDVTASNGRVHVLWDDGAFRPIMAEHLRLAKSANKQASSLSMRVSSLGDLSSFFESAVGKTASDTDLIHKATKDLWSFRKDGGDYVIERLFAEDGSPLKV